MTTSPLTPTEIERAFGELDAMRPPATLLGEWGRFGGFLRRPHMPDVRGREPGKARAVGRMLALDMVVMVALLTLFGLASALGFEPPDNVNNALGLSLGAIVLVVVIAPVLEELIFRSWLTGRPAVMAAIAVCVVGFGVVPYGVSQIDPERTIPLLLAIGPLVAMVAAPLAAYTLLSHPAPRLFIAGFPVFFWLSTLGFALVHLANYTDASWAMLGILLPLVLPQFALGTMLGYLRVHYGLGAAFALHASHNALLFGLALLSKSVEGAV
ncbi:MAG: CPBP family glutamic-type intramembrane protease [Pseudomonadota bacterium]